MRQSQAIVAFLLEVSTSAKESADGILVNQDPKADASVNSLIEDAYSIAHFADKLARYLTEDPQTVKDTAHAAVLLGLEVMDAARQDVLREFGNDGERIVWN